MQVAENLLWQAYELWPGAILILRGEHSSLLTAQTAQTMMQRHPRASLHEVAGVGHRPTFRFMSQLAVAHHFLLET